MARPTQRGELAPQPLSQRRISPSEITDRNVAEQGHSDGTPDVLAERLTVYSTATRPVLGLFATLGIVQLVDAT